MDTEMTFSTSRSLALTKFMPRLRGWASFRVSAAALAVVVWLFLVPERALTQQQSWTAYSETAAPLSSDELVSQLRHDQVLVMRAKQAIIHKREEKGQQPYEENLTDEDLFQLVREDAEVRTLIQSLLPTSGTSLKPPLAEERNPEPVPGERLKRVSPPAADGSQAAEEVRRNPYPGLPSTQDLYRQVPGAGAGLQRFGGQLFLNRNAGVDAFPTDLPVGPDYVLGPGDGLNINLWGSVSQRISVTVDRSGQIVLPEAGPVVVVGHTLGEAQSLIQHALGAQFKTARIDVSLTRLRSMRVYVVGDVERPGAYDISSLSTPLNALLAAGGPTAQGSLRTVRHYRGSDLVREVDIYDLLLNGIRNDVERIQAGDTILVPPVGPQVTVAGMVRRPAIYELRNDSDLSAVLELAGGLLVSATLREITVERIEAHQRRVTLSLSLPTGADGDRAALRAALGTFKVQDGDRVTIAPILAYSEQTVYVQGHVFRPGKYSYRQGMGVSDVIRSYQDLLPEPAQHAEVVRLTPPDYRPTVIEFRLNDVLGGDDPIELQPFDTIRIFGRYEIDVPKVSIYGEVLRPGEYLLGEGMTAADLVRMAGGFKRSAVVDEADITSYVVRDGKRVEAQHAPVNLVAALNGEAAQNPILKPQDVLTIRQLAGWSDIGMSVTVSGEVLYPGTYGIRESEKLSQLLQRAGGFRSTAYPQGAVLERVQVRELAERNRQELIQRIEVSGATAHLAPTASAQEQVTQQQAIALQQERLLTALRRQPANGRLVIRISGDIASWQNTASDVELRSGDVVTIPKEPSFVLVTGQVYNAAALTFTPNKEAGWYLRQAGGTTDMANKKDIFIIRANGAVTGPAGGNSWWGRNVLQTRMQRGDTLVVPEKVLGGSRTWRNLLETAQLSSSVAVAARVATAF